MLFAVYCAVCCAVLCCAMMCCAAVCGAEVCCAFESVFVLSDWVRAVIRVVVVCPWSCQAV